MHILVLEGWVAWEPCIPTSVQEMAVLLFQAQVYEVHT